jgi:DNA repair protein RadC
MDKKTGGYLRKAGKIPKVYHGFKVVDGDTTDLTFLQPNGVILGLRSKGKAENDITNFVKRDFDESLKANPNPKTNIPNIISPRSKAAKPKKTSKIPKAYLNKISGYPVQKEIVVGSIGASETLESLTPEVFVKVLRKNKGKAQVITDKNACAKIFREYIGEDKVETQELFSVMYLKFNNEVIGVYNHSKGGTNSTIADVKLILAGALSLMASNIILCHNHPSGNTRPSPADITLTEKVKEAESEADSND